MESVWKFIKAVLWILLIIVVINYIIAPIMSVVAPLFSKQATVEIDPKYNDIKGITNGGLTPDEVKKQLEDDNTPYSADEFEHIYIYDTENHVVFYRMSPEGSLKYPNISFAKSSNGLIWDGAFAMNGSISTNWWTGVHDFNTLKISQDTSLGLNYQSGVAFNWKNLMAGGLLNIVSLLSYANNTVSFSNFNAGWVSGYSDMNGVAQGIRDLSGATVNDLNTLQNYARKYIVDNILIPHYEQWANGVEIKLQNPLDETDKKGEQALLQYINTFYNYLYQQSKSNNKTDNNKLVDATDFMVKVIPENERKNYPISLNKQADYGNKQYYSLYKCKIIANCHYKYADVKTGDQKLIDVHVDPKEKPTIIPTPTKEYFSLSLVLSNKNNVDLTGFNIKTEPVTIQIDNRNIVFNTEDALKYGLEIAVEPNSSLFYSITSNGLVFNSYSGTVNVTEKFSKLSLPYTYEYGYVMTSVSLAQISSVDESQIDLTTNPVRIILTGKNGEGTYQFTFDDNSKLNQKINLLVKKGDYNYSVLSSQLIFNSTSGNLTVTAEERNFIFNYSVDTYLNDLKFTVTVTESSISGGNDIAISGDTSSVSLIQSKLNDDHYKVIVKLFDDDGVILGTYTHTHNSGTCGDNWATNGVLSVGTTYTGQLLYMSDNNENSYVSGIFNFIYKENTKFTFNYSCVEV